MKFISITKMDHLLFLIYFEHKKSLLQGVPKVPDTLENVMKDA